MKSVSKKSSATPAKGTASFFAKKSEDGFFNEPTKQSSFFGHAVQPKLTVGEPNDKFEKEADHTADRVLEQLHAPVATTEGQSVKPQTNVPGITSLVQEKCDACEEKDGKEKDDKPVQRQALASNVADSAGDSRIQTKCAECEREEGGIQKKESNAGGTSAAPGLESKLSSSKGGGAPLRASVNQSMSTAFGSDFSGVRVHNNAESANMNRQLNAQAFTHGSDIYFNSGKYDTSSKQGQHLLAHELTHTVQQGASKSGSLQKSPSVIQRDCTENSTTKMSIDEVTKNCPSPKGKITDSPKTIIINKLKVKQNAPQSILDSLNKDEPLPKPGSRVETPTKQASLWRETVKEPVTGSMEKLLNGLNADQTLDAKKDPKNKYTLKLKTGKGEAVLTGTFTELVNGALVSKWNTEGKTIAFQIEHILDYQIAGKKADDPENLMLLSASVNNNLGSVMKEYIRSDIADILSHYNKFVKAGTLVTSSDDAKKNYDIKAAGFERIDPDVPKDQEIVKKSLIDAATDPLRGNLTEVGTVNLKKGEFILKSNKKGGGVILPFHKKEFMVGSFKLTTNGDAEKESISEITATQIISGSHLETPPESKTYTLQVVDVKTKEYKANDFGVHMANLKLKYLSPIEFDEPDLDESLNVVVTGRIKTPGPSFLSKTPIEISLVGTELSIQKTFSADDLGKVGPIKVDESSLTLSLSSLAGLSASGMVAFSIPNTGKGSIDATGNKEGFLLHGKFDFDNKIFNPATVEVGYSSVKDKAGENPWTFKGNIGIEKGKVTGINKANLKIGYDNGAITLNGNADLDVPGVKSAKIDAQYKEGDFKMTIDASFDFKTKLIKDPKITVQLSSDESGWKLGVSGSADIVIPNFKTIGLTVSYVDGLFDAKAEVNDLKVGKYVTGNITLGATNSTVDDEGKATGKGDGKQFGFYGSGLIKVTLGENITSELGIKLSKAGKILITGKLTVTEQPLLKNDLLTFNRNLFEIETPKVPIFSVGVADVFLRIKGKGDAMAKVESPKISLTIDLKDTDIFNPQGFSIDSKITPQIAAEAGLDLGVSFIIGASALILEISADVGGVLKLHIKTGAEASLDLKWSPDKGLKFKHAEGKLTAGIVVSGAITGGLEVGLNLFLTKIKVWRKEWTLAEMKFGELGQMSFKFPIDFNDDGSIIAPKAESLEPQSPYSNRQGTESLLNQKAGGEKVQKKPEDFRKEIVSFFNTLPAIGPANPLYLQQRSRHFFVKELEDNYKDQDWQWLRAEWYSIEMGEFNILSNRLRQKRSSSAAGDTPQLPQFAIDHPMVPQAEIDLLSQELRKLNSGGGNVQKKTDSAPDSNTINLKPIFESRFDESEDHLQKKESTHEQAQSPSHRSAISNSADPVNIQRVPQAGEVLPSTDKQERYYKYRNDVVDILGKPTFDPGRNLGNYISSMWENHQEPAINVKVGNMGEGYIYLKPGAGFEKKNPICVPIGILLSVCIDVPPDAATYNAVKQVIPITHPAFGNRDDGTLVYVVEITNGFINGVYGWIPGKKAGSIDPLLDAELAQTNEDAFLQLIYGKEYDGTNYVSAFFKNQSLGGSLFFHTMGILQLPNQQKIEGLFIMNDELYRFKGDMIAKPEGLDTYDAPVTRTPDAEISAETTALTLDYSWTSGKADDEDGFFTASSQIQLTYRNHTLQIFGTAKYASARFNGEVNVSVTTKSESDKLFATHAAAVAKEKKGVATAGDAKKEDPSEPLALTAWGDLDFKLIDSSNKTAGAKKSAIDNLEGKASFVVSSDGFIILAGRVKLPTDWKLSPELNYTSTDAEDKDKHLFQHEQSVVEAWVPEALGSIEVKVGIVVDADAHLDPLKLYEIEVSGVYSNHPKYRSEVNLTPKFFLSGNAGASVTISAEGVYRFLGLIKTASLKGALTGTGRISAYIDAAPTVSKIWDGGENAAAYALSGIIRTGGELTFALDGELKLTVTGIDLFHEENYHIGRWTLKSFGVELKMDEYLLGSGATPKIDYGKMGMNGGQRHSLGQSITEEIEGKKSGPDKRTGGFEQEEDGKMKEKGTFSATPPPPHPDHSKDAVDNRIEESFLMGNHVHSLVILIGGTRENPTAQLKMASGNEEPLIGKIEDEKTIIAIDKALTADPVKKKQAETQIRDLNNIEREASNIEKNAKETAQQETVNDPKVAGFDQIDDHLSNYAQQYHTDDLGNILPSVPAPAPSAGGPKPVVTPPLGVPPASGGKSGTNADIKNLKTGDLLSVPYKNGRGRAEVLEITTDFVTILIKTKKGGTGDIKNLIPRSRFKDLLNTGDIFIWSELRQFLMNNRPKYAAGLVQQVWDNAAAIQADGKVRDPNPPYEILTWHRSKSRYLQWHMGHKPGHKYSDLVDQLVNEEIDWDTFIAEYNKPGNYSPELPSKNMGHGFEDAEPEQ